MIKCIIYQFIIYQRLKWKPSDENTVDFKIGIIHDKLQNHYILNLCKGKFRNVSTYQEIGEIDLTETEQKEFFIFLIRDGIKLNQTEESLNVIIAKIPPKNGDL